jgi:hypothetical protein
MPVSYLASKSAKSTVYHYSEAIRIIKYLSATPNVGLVFTYNNGKVNVKVYTDVSHCTITYMRTVTDMEVYSFHLVQHLFLAQYKIEMYYKVFN